MLFDLSEQATGNEGRNWEYKSAKTDLALFTLMVDREGRLG